MARRGAKKVRKSIVQDEAEAVADEVIFPRRAEPPEEDEPEFEDDGAVLDFGASTSAEDVFEEGFKRAVEVKDSPRYHIKKNSTFLTVKDYPYSWERLQAEYGPGYYQVICKRRSNGYILKQQTEMVGDPNEGRAQAPPKPEVEAQAESNLATLGFLQQSQERAEERATAQARQSESNFASMFQSISMAQAESTKVMMQMMMESNKQTQSILLALMQNQQNKGPDPLITLVTAMLTKEKPKEGMGFAEVLKLLADKERDTRTSVERQYELIEKKADELAELKAAGLSSEDEEKDDSLVKTLAKAFVPVITQMAAQNPQAQAQVQAAPPAPITPQSAGQRPQTAALPPRPTPPARPGTRPLSAESKDKLFDQLAPTIAEAMLAGKSGPDCATELLAKLEKEGASRQTVAGWFTVEDFYAYADKFIPADSLPMAKEWLKEFHSALQTPKSGIPPATAKPVVESRAIPVGNAARAESAHADLVRPEAGRNSGGGTINEHGRDAAIPVPPERSGGFKRAGTKPRQPAETV